MKYEMVFGKFAVHIIDLLHYHWIDMIYETSTHSIWA